MERYNAFIIEKMQKAEDLPAENKPTEYDQEMQAMRAMQDKTAAAVGQLREQIKEHDAQLAMLSRKDKEEEVERLRADQGSHKRQKLSGGSHQPGPSSQ